MQQRSLLDYFPRKTEAKESYAVPQLESSGADSAAAAESLPLPHQSTEKVQASIASKRYSEAKLIQKFQWSEACVVKAEVYCVADGYRAVCRLEQDGHSLDVGDLHLKVDDTTQKKESTQDSCSTTRSSRQKSKVETSVHWVAQSLNLTSFYNYFQEKREFHQLAERCNLAKTTTRGFMAEALYVTLIMLLNAGEAEKTSVIVLNASGLRSSDILDAPNFLPLAKFYQTLGFQELYPGLLRRYEELVASDEYQSNPKRFMRDWEVKQTKLKQSMGAEIRKYYEEWYVSLEGIELQADIGSIIKQLTGRCEYLQRSSGLSEQFVLNRSVEVVVR